MNAKDAETLAKSFDIEHPHLFYKFLISDEPNTKKYQLLKNLNDTLSKSIGVQKNFKSNKALIHYAFKNSAEREEARRNYIKKHRHSY